LDFGHLGHDNLKSSKGVCCVCLYATWRWVQYVSLNGWYTPNNTSFEMVQNPIPFSRTFL